MNLDNIELQDIITLDNNIDYIVLGKAKLDEIDYLYLLNNEDYSMNFAAIADNQIVMLDNKEDKMLINSLLPMFLDSISKNVLDDLIKKEETTNNR